MYSLDKLERYLGWIAVRNLSLYLIIGQVFVLLATMLQSLDPVMLMYAPFLLLEGEWWRPVTFLFVIPLPSSLFGFVFTAFGWYLFYLMGNALEDYWGAFRFTLYLLLSYAATIALSFVTPGAPVTNMFILGSVFLAFAFLNPDFELILFFILPVKIKWLALIAWVWNGFLFATGGLPQKLQIAASVGSFLVFFGGDMIRTIRQGRRTAARRVEREIEEAAPRHRCHVCGKTDKSHPDLDFRYCSQCAGDQCYCPEHIRNHTHVVAADDGKSA